ncbi:MAG TPA: YbaK/EbsC family protein [Actinobacteria bacterium]|nr:YbaK/EbsC family protein [Actinomycetota bacterium]
MALNPMIKEYLDGRRVNYEEVSHPQAFTTIEEARVLKVDVDEVAKTLVVHMGNTLGDLAMVVVPGGQKVSRFKMREVFANKHARLLTEDELLEDFPQFELGAVPPLAELFDLPVYFDQRILEHETVVISGGTHTDSLKIDVQDLFNLADSVLVDLVDKDMAA